MSNNPRGRNSVANGAGNNGYSMADAASVVAAAAVNNNNSSSSSSYATSSASVTVLSSAASTSTTTSAAAVAATAAATVVVSCRRIRRNMDAAVIVSSLLALVLYWNTLDADFAYDDSRAIKTNQDLLPSAPLTGLFYNDFWGTPLTHSGSHKSYRPLCVLSFRLNHYLGELRPYGYHLGNVLLHALVTGLFAHLARHFLRHSLPTWVAGLLFASHPVHTEAVAGVVGRADVGSCLFFLLALISYIKYCKYRDKLGMDNAAVRWSSRANTRFVYLGASLVSAAASLLTKEHGITVLAVCATYDILVHTRLRPKDLLSVLFEKRYRGLLEGLAALMTSVAVLMTLRIQLMGSKPPDFAPADNPAADSDSLLTRTLTFLYLPTYNFWLLLCPRWLSFDWSMEALPLITSPLDFRNVYTATFYAGLAHLSLHVLDRVNGGGCGGGGGGGGGGSSGVGGPGGGGGGGGGGLGRGGGGGLHRRVAIAGSVANGNAVGNGGHRYMSINHNYKFVVSSSMPSTTNKKKSNNGSASSRISNGYYSGGSNGHAMTSSSAFSAAAASSSSSSSLADSSTAACLLNATTLIPSASPPPPASMLGTCSSSSSSSSSCSSSTSSTSSDLGYWSNGQPQQQQQIPSTVPYPYAACSTTAASASQQHHLYSNSSSSWTTSRSNNYRVDLLVVSLTILVFPFVPATNLFFYVGFVVAERVLYIPSMGFCLLVGLGVQIVHRSVSHSQPKRRALICVCALLVIVFCIRTVRRNRDWLTEENLYRSGIPVNPPKAFGNLANILSAQGKKEEAEWAYKKALSYRSNMADVHYNLGILLQEQKRFEEAQQSYRLAIQFRPRMAMAHLNLGLILGILGRKEEATEVYRHCSQLDGTGLKDPRMHENTKISALFNLGRLYADDGRYMEAIEVYKEAVRKMPGHYQPQSLYNMLGEAYFKLERYEEAEHWYKEALRAKPDHIPAHLTYGKMLAKLQNRVSEAEQWFARAKLLAPNDSSVYQHYGQFLSETERHAEAANQYVRAAELAPDEYEIIFNAANTLRQAGKNEDAEKYYRMAVKLRPSEATSHMNLGAMLHVNGKLLEAELSYLEALKLKPDDGITQNNLQKLRNLLSKRGIRTTHETKR